MNTLGQKLEALLFYKAEPVSLKELSGLLEVGEEDVREATKELHGTLGGRGVRLVEVNNTFALATAPEHAELIEKIRKEELSKDLGKAGAETLAIVLYKGPVTRSEIDYIRGVNSTFILRNLLIRDLVERIPNPKDQRSFLYRPTHHLLSHLGIERIEELSEFDTVKDELEAFAKIKESNEN